MRIVQVVSGLGWVGGVQEYVAGLSSGLAVHGHEVVILAGGRPPPDGPAPHALAEGMNIRFHPKRRVARRYLYPTGLPASLRECGRWADVIHVHQPFFTGTWMAAATRLPLAGTLYLHPEHLMRPGSGRRRRLLQLLLRRMDLVVGVSHAELDLIGTVARPRRSGVVWPALAELPQVTPRRRVRPLVVYVGRLSRSKNLDTLIRAFALLPPEVDTVVMGGGPDAEMYESLCTEVGLDGGAVVRSSVTDDDIVDLLREASVFVSVSGEESFGIAPLRAIAHGCRPVLSDIPSHREILVTLGVEDEHLVDPQVGPAGLAAAIESAIRAPRLSAESAARVPTWADSGAAVAELYERMLEDRRRPR